MRFCLWLVLALALPSAVAADGPAAYHIETVAGSDPIAAGGPATAAELGTLQGVAADHWGNFYLSDTDRHRVCKVAPDGTISTVAGTGSPGFSGDGGPAALAQLNLPYGLAADSIGNLYIADLGNNRVRRIGPDGVIATVSGTGAWVSAGDGGPAVQASLLIPRNVAVDAALNLYISEFGANRVRKVTPDGRISTVAGTGVAGYRGDGGAGPSAQLAFPAGLALDRAGALYIADSQNLVVRKLLPGGAISTVLGADPATRLATPVGLAVDTSGTIYVADNTSIVHGYTTAKTSVVAAGNGTPGFSGDGGPAASARLAFPRDLALDASGNLLIADSVRVRRVDAAKIIRTVAGDGYVQAVGDGGDRLAAALSQPSSVALDLSGDLYIADTGTQRVRRVLPSGTILTAAGMGAAGFGSEPAPATSAPLSSPMGVAVDPAGVLYLADTYNQRIRQVDAGGSIRTVVGTGVAGYGPELTAPAQTPLRNPRGICFDRAGALYVADSGNHRVLRVAGSLPVVTVAGSGSQGYAGDGGAARLAPLNQPSACALDSAGNLFIADTFNHAIRKVARDGTIVTVAGTGTAGSTGDGGPATAAHLTNPRGVAIDDNGDIFIADTSNQRIRQVTPDGIIHTIAGQGTAGFAGDGGPAASALLNNPGGLVLDGAGDLYFADTGNNRIRRLVPGSAIPVAQIAVANAAGGQAGPVAPGELVVISGAGLPADPGAAAVEVYFAGALAAVLSAQPDRIVVQVPYAVAGSAAAHVVLLYQGTLTGQADVAVATAAPALFATAANLDGSINSETNPAPRGGIVTFYGTGEGLTDGPNVTAAPAAVPYPHPLQPVSLMVAGMPAEILYAGSAPGLVGVLQINARVPAAFVPVGAVPVELSVGDAVAPDITLWVR